MLPRYYNDAAVAAATVASVLDARPDLHDTARRLLADRSVLAAILRADMGLLADGWHLTDADLDQAAARIAGGADPVGVMADYPAREGCWVGIPVAWTDLVGQWDTLVASGPIVVTAAGAVSDVLAYDRDLGDYGYEYVEYVTELLPRVDLPGGLQAVVLPPKVEGVRTYAPAARPGPQDMPATTYLQVDAAIDQEAAARVQGVPGLQVCTSDRQVTVAMPRRAGSGRTIN